MPSARTLLASAFLLAFCSCGTDTGTNATSHLDAGSSALSVGDYVEALARYEQALDLAEQGTDEHAGAKLGQLQALAHADPKRLTQEIPDGTQPPQDDNQMKLMDEACVWL